jgi:hypothetical protein
LSIGLYIIDPDPEKYIGAGKEVDEKSEYKTSSRCPRCHSEEIMTRGRLLKCLFADWKQIGMLREPKRAVNNQSMNTLEARIFRL